MRLLRTLPALLALLLAAPAAAPAQTISQEGRWLVDEAGRVVILQGVNMVYKRPPYHPSAIGFDAADARFLAAQGFNTVRLGLIYAGVEPTPGAYDDAYIERIRETARALARERIWFQLDFHQDLYNERFEGEGWPEWAVYDDGLPAEPKLGFPANYFSMPGLIRAFDNFWANVEGPGGVGLQDRYAAAWRHVAAGFRDEPYLLGYDLLNEPWPGTPWFTCGNTEGCPAFDTQVLQPFNEKMANAIREADPNGIVWYEPNVLFNNGPETHLGDVAGPAGMSYHVYCLEEQPQPSPADEAQEESCRLREDLPFSNANDHSEKTGNTLLLSEFGATDDLGAIERIVERAERSMISWQYWHYCQCDDPTTTGVGPTQALVIDPAKPPSGDNLKEDKLDVLARVFPRVVAGTPTGYGFDREQRTFSLDYSTKRAGGGAFGPGAGSEIFVPRRHYPGGYDVTVTGGDPVSPASASRLRIRTCAGRDEVRVRLRPGSGERTADCAAPAGRKKPRLRLRVRPRRAQAGRRVRFRFRAFVRSGRRRVYVKGVRIRFAGKRARTRGGGRATIRATFSRPGRRRARAVKRGMRRGRATVRVRPG
jgi:endoglycosylceramidase